MNTSSQKVALSLFTIVFTTISLSQNASCENILVLSPFGSGSVRAVFSLLSDSLAKRGHDVTFISSGAPIPKEPRVTHILSPHTGLDDMDQWQLRNIGIEAFKQWIKVFPILAKSMYDNPRIMDVYHKRQTYDSVIVNGAANEMAFPLLQDVEAPIILLAPSGAEPIQLYDLGNLVSPAAMTSIMLPYDDRMTFTERVINTLSMFAMRYALRRAMESPMRAALMEKFPNLPPSVSVLRRQSLLLVNRHHEMDGPLPLLPNQVEIGCLNCRQPKPLPEDIKRFIEGSGPAGVIFFSLGSQIPASSLPMEYRKALFDAFSRLPQRIIMRYTPTDDIRLPSNVYASAWLPQQDILGAPEVKIFISHCGRASTSEAKYHGVPILGLPVALDQPSTCSRLQRRGEAIVLQWEEVTVDLFIEAVNTLLTDESYAKKMQGTSRRIQSEKQTSLDKAIWWVEHVMEHGTEHLKFVGSELSFFQYILMDVFALLIGALLVIGITLYFTLRTLFRQCCRVSRKLKNN